MSTKLNNISCTLGISLKIRGKKIQNFPNTVKLSRETDFSEVLMGSPTLREPSFSKNSTKPHNISYEFPRNRKNVEGKSFSQVLMRFLTLREPSVSKNVTNLNEISYTLCI